MWINHSFIICVALVSLIAFAGCRKDLVLFSIENVQTMIPPDKSGACDNIPSNTNFVSILFRSPDGSILPMTCLTEKEIVQILKDGGLNSEETGAALSKLFYKAEAATPARAFQLGQWMATFYGFSPESFNIDVMGRGDYPAPVSIQSSTKSKPIPGFIDFYTIRQARAAPNEGLILQSGFSGLRFQNQCTGQMVTFNFPPTLDGFKSMFIDAGFSEKETNLIVGNITNGHYSIRQIWELFQLALAPQLPITQGLLSKPDASCWRLRHVGIGLYNAENTITSFYFAQGDGALK